MREISVGLYVTCYCIYSVPSC